VRFLLTPDGGSRPSLVVETVDDLDDTKIASFRSDLHGLACSNGILFDRTRCVILRDTFESMDESSFAVEEGPAANAVLARAGGGSLEDRVDRWLRMLSASWDRALPIEPETAAPFIADIVPAASGSLVHPVESVR
jgi:hypothetical protein